MNLLPGEVKEKFKRYVYIKDVAKFMDIETSVLYGVAEFDALFHGFKFWYRPDNMRGKASKASTAFMKSEFASFPMIDRLVITKRLPNGSCGTDEFGYSYVTIYGDKP